MVRGNPSYAGWKSRREDASEVHGGLLRDFAGIVNDGVVLLARESGFG